MVGGKETGRGTICSFMTFGEMMPDVVIVGAGPVGLFMGVLLLQRGHEVRILERRSCRSSRSRAIGIHPPALAALARAGVADPLITAGVRIKRVVAFSRRRPVAELAFDGDPGFPFILAVPQPVTEEALELAVKNLDADAIVRGADVQEVVEDLGHVRTIANCPAGVQDFSSRLVVAADGAHSAIRGHYLPGLPDRSYPDSYIMGDFPDSTGHGSDAVLYLEPGGIVESFPLPGAIRRWVVRLGAPEKDPTVDKLAHLVLARTGEVLDVPGNSMLSAFEVRSAFGSPHGSRQGGAARGRSPRNQPHRRAGHEPWLVGCCGAGPDHRCFVPGCRRRAGSGGFREVPQKGGAARFASGWTQHGSGKTSSASRHVSQECGFRKRIRSTGNFRAGGAALHHALTGPGASVVPGWLLGGWCSSSHRCPG